MTGRNPDLEHVHRPALPWRDETMTECGLPATSDRRIISRDAFRLKVRREGIQRSALTTCMTCWHTARRWEVWNVCPADILRRELQNFHNAARTERLNAELRAIAALIAAHRDEFDSYLTGLAQTTDLTLLREARRRRLVKEGRTS